jgi:uncharacterized protein
MIRIKIPPGPLFQRGGTLWLRKSTASARGAREMAARWYDGGEPPSPRHEDESFASLNKRRGKAHHDQWEDQSMTGEQAVAFTVGALRLQAMLAVPAGARRAAVVCHPHPQFGGSMDNNVVIAAASALGKAGVATLRFNFRGVGDSEGQHANGIGEVDDVRAAADCLRARAGLGTIAIVGYSFGATVGLQAGRDDPGVDRLVAIAPPVTMFDIAFLRHCTKPVLFVAGTADPFCPEGALEQSAQGLGLHAEIVRLPGADHFFFGYEATLGNCCVRFLREPPDG